MTTVDSGQAGVVVTAGEVNQEVVKPGFAINLHPLANLEIVNTKAKMIDMSKANANNVDTTEIIYAPAVGILTSENLKVPVDVSVLYRIKQTAIIGVRINYGIDTVWEEKLIIKKARAIIREAIGKASVYDLNKNRSQYEATIIGALQERLGEYLTIEQVNINNIPLPTKIKEAVEAKMVESELASSANYKLKRIKVEAQQEIERKKGVADAQKILSKSITPDLIRWKELEIKEIEANTWNGELPEKLLMGADVPVVISNN
jgi:regulator of protease activity HflC (stomatin/prohibitin superfamily)